MHQFGRNSGRSRPRGSWPTVTDVTRSLLPPGTPGVGLGFSAVRSVGPSGRAGHRGRDEPAAPARGGALALSDLKRVLTGIRADVVEAERSVLQVHTRVDAAAQFSDPELAAQIGQLLSRLADLRSRAGPALAHA